MTRKNRFLGSNPSCIIRSQPTRLKNRPRHFLFRIAKNTIQGSSLIIEEYLNDGKNACQIERLYFAVLFSGALAIILYLFGLRYYLFYTFALSLGLLICLTAKVTVGIVFKTIEIQLINRGLLQAYSQNSAWVIALSYVVLFLLTGFFWPLLEL